jgi:hypothetical protein
MITGGAPHRKSAMDAVSGVKLLKGGTKTRPPRRGRRRFGACHSGPRQTWGCAVRGTEGVAAPAARDGTQLSLGEVMYPADDGDLRVRLLIRECREIRQRLEQRVADRRALRVRAAPLRDGAAEPPADRGATLDWREGDWLTSGGAP